MLRRSAVYQFDHTRILDDITAQHLRRARLYPIGIQAHTRSRMAYFRNAPVPVSTSDAECEFVLRARRHRPMQAIAEVETWTANSDPTNPWSTNSNPVNTWS